ncbi:MAG: hypothetical protein HC905_30935, partial [Bacteroidales bacterium]|nr:hypothetical protein [Bacteroidales bacterium]
MSSPVNSTFDEHFVFYDETAPALYFTSQGHNSAGGYDIFRSYYDKPTNKWSKPENLGFPINTPFDEVAYVTVPGTQKSILVSRRNSGPGKLVVYFLDNADANAEETTLTPQAREIGHLRLGKQKFTAFSKTTTEKEKPHLKSPNEVPEEIRNEKTYQRLIHDALNLQIRSDSIKRLSDDKKEAMIASSSESEKTKLRQEIKTLDERAALIQQKADVLYKKRGRLSRKT